MTITQNTLTSHGDSADANSYTTASSFTPGANRLVLAFVENSKGSTADTPTVSGNSLTWVQVTTVTFSTGNRRRLTLFRAMGASPTNGALTADFAGVNQTSIAISVFEFDGVDTSGTNGSGAIVQAPTPVTGAAVSSVSITLAAFGSASNGASAGVGATANVGITHDTGWNEIHDITSVTVPATALETQWIATNDTTASGTMVSGTADMGIIAIEVKAAATGRTNQYLTLVGVG